MIIANLLTDDGNPTHVFNNLDIMLFFFRWTGMHILQELNFT